MKFLKKQLGVSLIEVLVSMALGIFFLGVAVEYLITGQQSSGVQDAGSRIQENARFSFSILQDDVRLAGYNGNPAALVNPAFIYQGNCNLSNPCTTDDVGAFGDRFAISFVSDTDINADCTGAGFVDGTQAANIYWVEDDDGDGVNSLYCMGWNILADAPNSGAQPLIDGVEHMQVQYGISTGADSNRFLSAAGVTAVDDWASVRSVRIALLVDSGLQTDAADVAGNQAFVDEGRTYSLLDVDVKMPDDDNRIRRVYATTIELNNSF